MGFGSMLFGDPEKKRRQKQEKDELDQQENKRLKQINKAYVEAKVSQRIENAKAKGVADANRLANQKPLYQKLMGAAATVGKDLVKGSGNVNTDAFFTWGTPKQNRSQSNSRLPPAGQCKFHRRTSACVLVSVAMK